MPLYEYECEAENGRRFEIIQKFSDADLTVCPTCGGPVRKLISSPAIQFKGSGFYITDYAKKSGTDAGQGVEGIEADIEVGSSASGDSSSSSSSASQLGAVRRARAARRHATRGRAAARRPRRTEPPVYASGRATPMLRQVGLETARPGPDASGRSRPPPSGSPACCRCRGGRRRSRRRRSAGASAARAGRWSAGSRRCGRARSSSSVAKMSGRQDVAADDRQVRRRFLARRLLDQVA